MKQFNFTYILSFLCLISLGLSIFTISQARNGNSSTSQISPTFSSNLLQQIKDKGQLDACVAVLPPAVIKSANGDFSGHDIEIVNSLAKRMQVKANFVESTFGSIVPSIQSGKCQIATTFFAQIPRAMSVAFSKPLFYSGLSALSRQGETRFNSLQDLDKEGITIATSLGEGGDNFAKEYFKKAKINSIPGDTSDVNRFMIEVTSGRADVAIADAQQINLFSKANPQTLDLFVKNPFQISPVNIAMPNTDPGFVQFINTALDFMETTGEIDIIFKKYDATWIREVKTYQIR